MENIQPNYQNRKRKNIHKNRRKKQVLTILLATSLGLNGITIISTAVKKFTDQLEYNESVRKQYELVDENTHKTDNKQYDFVDAYELASDIKSNLEVKEKDDMYHHLIAIMKHIEWNRNENFRSILAHLDLDKLSAENEKYPSMAELETFLETKGFINEDGTIDFDSWEKYDKKVINLENDIEKAGKHI